MFSNGEMDAFVEQPEGSRLSITPIVIAFILTLTAIPFELRAPSWSVIEIGSGAGDLIRNIILFLPLGLFSNRGLFATVVLGAAVSTCAEGLQLFSANRYPALADIVTNITGSALGWLLSGRVPQTIGLTRRLCLVCVAGGLVLSLAMIPQTVRTDISNWDSRFSLKAGAEAGMEQAWRGQVQGVAVRAGAMSADEIAGMATRGVGDLERRVPANDAALFKAISETGQFTVLFWGSTEDLAQRGPARMVAWAGNGFDSNMTVGQDGPRIVFRVRTIANGANGGRQETRTGPVLEAGRSFFFAGTYDGVVARVFINGVAAAENNLSVRLPLSHLPGLSCALMSGYLLALGSRLFRSRAGMDARLLTGLIAVGCLGVTVAGWGRVPIDPPLRLAAVFAAGVVVAGASVRK